MASLLMQNEALVASLSLPINLTLLASIGFLIYRLVWPCIPSPSRIPTSYKSGYSWMPEKHPQVALFKQYTPVELEKYNGVKEKRILLAIAGKVFDVTAGAGFYGPEGPYGNFAGRDASRGMAKQSFDVEMLTPVDAPIDTLQDLTSEERANMKSWKEHFTNKYIVVGELVENGTAV
ncbi:cytochrome b5 [Dacryopinax primogenitus]|uniref:Cytochrome b5 n=1 Tax=Dacryopinax primogenitus (strain DJM 731) TaxID=1858805 RepID=M5GD79_DACPD|nr:cytochrome b5 [Dacryopinax primogenitus]EJU04327.1 cytochrome b5 [Dacryopinax primogenitus]